MDHAHVIATLALVIADLARGETKSATEGLDRALRALRAGAQQGLPGVAASAPPAAWATGERKEAAARLFSYWVKRCDKGERTMLTAERGRAVIARLRDGYTEAEIRKAIDGAATAAYVGDSGQRYDDLELICRSGAKLESFIERGETTTGKLVVVAAAGGQEDDIAALRREMATLRRDGREIEYGQAAARLQTLMAKRGPS